MKINGKIGCKREKKVYFRTKINVFIRIRRNFGTDLVL